jgi:AraC family transcriptional regulator of adaptative response / DNA-3-methyladenine glycosylase II
VLAYGEPVDGGEGPGRLFPSVEVLAEMSPEEIAMPRARGRALTALCAALAAGDVVLDRSADRADVREALLALPGIGAWTADYIALRALGDPDVFLSSDIGTRHALDALGADPREAGRLAERWRPWRSYAQLHLWSSLTAAPAADPRSPTKEK